MTRKFGLWLLSAFVSAVPVSAQTYGLPGSQIVDPVGYYINQSFWSNKAFGTMMRNSIRTGSKGKTSAATPTGPTGPTIFKQSTTFILPDALAARAIDANSKAQTKRIAEELLNLYRQTAATDGFPSNDLAYAFEYFVVNNYQVYNYLLDIPADPSVTSLSDPLARLHAIKVKEQSKVTLTQERAIYNQFRSVLSENPEVKKMTDLQKQEATEALAVMTGMAYLQFSQGSRNKSTDQMEQGRQIARANLEKLVGGSADRISITNSGLGF